jgi:hypothetical protein
VYLWVAVDEGGEVGLRGLELGQEGVHRTLVALQPRAQLTTGPHQWERRMSGPIQHPSSSSSLPMNILPDLQIAWMLTDLHCSTGGS